MGTQFLVRLSTALSLFSVLPSMVFLVVALPHANSRVLTEDDGGRRTNWNDLLTWVLWLYSGVLNVGSVASEVNQPGRTYLSSGVVLLIMDVIFVNFTPLWFSLSIDSNRENYTSGHFADLAGELAGMWLKYMMVLGAQVTTQIVLALIMINICAC
jgi:hypothetical protein